MGVKERLDNRNNENVIYIGEVVERAYNGEFGDVLRAYINGKLTEALIINQDNPVGRDPLNADRLLGRCEGYVNVLNDLEQFIQDKNKLLMRIPEETEDAEG